MVERLELKRYVDWNVNSVITIKKGYGFRISLIFSDGSETIQQKSGFSTQKEANAGRDLTIAELHKGNYVVYGKIKVKIFLEHWLEYVMREKISSDSYDSYRNVIYNYIIPEFGEKYMSTINREHVQKLYKHAVARSESVSGLVKTVMNTSMKFALSKNVVAQNTAEGVNLPKGVKKKEYRIRKIDVQKTLTVEQVILLIQKSKETPIYLHILFAAMMGLRRSEINGLKYEDVDYLHRTLRIQRQLGKKPNTSKEDVPLKMLTKQDIKLKTYSSYRELDIPDIVFEAILEQRKIYERNRRRRPKEFRDLDYICCSTYGNPRSKSFHHKYYKDLLKELVLPDIRFHALRSTITTILMKNNFNLKGISKMLGHASEIISADVYGDTQEIIEDCLDKLEPFIMEVVPAEMDGKYHDYSDMGEVEAYCEELLAA